LPKLYLVRHGDTKWTDTHRHTGRSDIPLTESGRRHARELAEALPTTAFAAVFTSPLQRAAETCALAGFGGVAQFDPDLLEWDYGSFEGMTTAEILKLRPDWELFRDGGNGGETPGDVAARADHFIAKARATGGDVLAFASGHIIRMIAARWLGLPPSHGRFFFCRPASIGELGYEHEDREQPILGVWNYVKR
jgi:probable phosphoglycerate mutase